MQYLHTHTHTQGYLFQNEMKTKRINWQFYIQTKPKPSVCWIASDNFLANISLQLYCGKSNRLAHVCATGKKSSPLLFGWIVIYKRKEIIITTVYCIVG